ncbi:hypothetical protein CTI12_AA431740 [Artemisia annua]|uniref:alpha,alpha-trehalase n=1 Tax=Artemisia annua TaxID=35608 RepID=A0A2U1M0Z9_ARTAN|nr:hypothetical protein CTI12_AA431740 [Artemisia annua]
MIPEASSLFHRSKNPETTKIYDGELVDDDNWFTVLQRLVDIMQKNYLDRKLQLFEDNEEVTYRITNSGCRIGPLNTCGGTQEASTNCCRKHGVAVKLPGRSNDKIRRHWSCVFVELFPSRGLLASKMYETTKGIVLNLIDLIDAYGSVLNGARAYYTNRRTQKTAGKLTNDCEKEKLYREVASTVETGWDFSTRWLK